MFGHEGGLFTLERVMAQTSANVSTTLRSDTEDLQRAVATLGLASFQSSRHRQVGRPAAPQCRGVQFQPRALAAGATRFMTKPFDPDGIVAEARAVLGQSALDG